MGNMGKLTYGKFIGLKSWKKHGKPWKKSVDEASI